MTDPEIALTGGNATAGVVRVGDTVRKPTTGATASVHRFLAHLAAAAVDVPRVYAHDDAGRQVIEFIPGTMADALLPLDAGTLHRVGRMIRDVHDASAGYRDDAANWHNLIPAPGTADLICHNDLTPWNLVTGQRWVFIDWDGAAPSTVAWDLAYSAQSFALLAPDEDPRVAAARLRTFLDGYGADAALRAQVIDTLAPRAAAMHAMLRRAHDAGEQPWGSMFVDGHGAYWAAVSEYVAQHRPLWHRVAGRETVPETEKPRGPRTAGLDL